MTTGGSGRTLASSVLGSVLTLGVLSAGCAPGSDANERELDDPGSPIPHVPRAVAPPGPPANSDSVTAAPGKAYPAAPFERWFRGDLNRDLWVTPLRVAVLDLDSVGGALEPEELSGGMQTLGLRFRGRDGWTYQFRSIVKNSEALVPRALERTFVAELIDDQMSAQLPTGAAVAARLAEALGILVALPRLVVVPDDARLGTYRDAFAGRMGWIEARPEDIHPDAPPFAGADEVIDTDDLIERMATEPGHRVDARAFLRARLLDLLIGDWDRHEGQWFWAGYREGSADGDTVWLPIPRDRDWAFSRVDGVVGRLAGLYYPAYVGFGPQYPPMRRLARSGRVLDRRFLQGLDREDFVRTANEMRETLTDEVLRAAVGALPRAHHTLIADDLMAALAARRDALADAAADFHAYVD